MYRKTLKIGLIITSLTSFIPLSLLSSTKNYSDFSEAFLAGTYLNQKPEPKILPLENSLEYIWQHLAANDVNDDLSRERQYELYLKTEYEITADRNYKADQISQLLQKLNPPIHAQAARARLLFESGKFFELIQSPFFSHIEQAEDWETSLMGARAYEMLGLYSKAEKLFDKALEKHPDKEQLVYHRIMLEIKKNNLDGATKIIDNFLSNSNKKARHAIFYQLKAVLYIQPPNNNYPAALKAINQSIELNARNDKSFKIKLAILEQLKTLKMPVDQQELIETYKLAAALDEDVNFKKAIVGKLFYLGLFTQAYEQLLQIKESSTEHQFDLALLAFKSQKFNLALAHLEKALTKKTAYLKCILLKLEVLAQVDATNCLDFAIQLFGQQKYRALACKAIFQLINKVSNPEPAIQLFVAEQKAKPNDLRALLHLAEANFLAQRYLIAIALYQQLEPQLSNYDNIAMILRHKINYNCALAALCTNDLALCQQRLNRLFPVANELPEIYHLAAIFNLQQQDFKRAFKLASIALKKQPLNLAFLDTLRTAAWFIGQPYLVLQCSMTINALNVLGNWEAQHRKHQLPF